MEALATVVFERTPQGAVAIKSTSNDVPRHLRTLLLAVDGRSPVAQYVPFLTAFAPLSEKFAELEQMGFLKRKGSVASQAVDRFEAAIQNSGFGAQLPRIDSASPDSGFVPLTQADLLALASTPAAVQARSVANAFELELQALANQMSGTLVTTQAALATQRPEPMRARVEPVSNKPVLADLLHEMDRFLSQSTLPDALPISLMLNQIKTLQQLRHELPAYFELVQSHGPAAEQHIERLAGMLDKADY